MGTIAKLVALGQSLWMDNIRRHLLENGETKALIDRGDIRGITSNPTIFDRAISDTADYHDALTSLAWAGWDAEKIFWELAVEDVREAADLFTPLYESSEGQDGYVSIEVSPLLAKDTEGTIAQAQQLWARVARPNQCHTDLLEGALWRGHGCVHVGLGGSPVGGPFDRSHRIRGVLLCVQSRCQGRQALAGQLPLARSDRDRQRETCLR
jgi:hypothetical protein